MLSKPDGRDHPPVIGFARMGGAAIAEEPGRIGIGTVMRPFRRSDAGRAQPPQAEARQVEQQPVTLALGEMPPRLIVFAQEGIEQFPTS